MIPNIFFTCFLFLVRRKKGTDTKIRPSHLPCFFSFSFVRERLKGRCLMSKIICLVELLTSFWFVWVVVRFPVNQPFLEFVCITFLTLLPNNVFHSLWFVFIHPQHAAIFGCSFKRKPKTFYYHCAVKYIETDIYFASVLPEYLKSTLTKLYPGPF